MLRKPSAIETLKEFVSQLEISKDAQFRLLLLVDEADNEAYSRGYDDGYDSGCAASTTY